MYSVALYPPEQQERDKESFAAVDYYLDGYTDGRDGSAPDNPRNSAYWQGYSDGLRDFWLSFPTCPITNPSDCEF